MVETVVSETPSSIYTTLEYPLSEDLQRTILIYGASGTQKTRTAAQFPSPLFLSCDPGQLGGLASGAEFKPKQIRIESWAQLQKALPTIEKDAGTEFKTLILDSTTYFQKIVMRDILRTTAREIPRYEDWNLCIERIRSILNQLANLKCNFVITATEQLLKDEISGKIMGLPNIPGKLAQELPAGVDVCLHFYVKSGYDANGKKKTSYWASSVPDDMWYGKDRFGILPAEFELLQPKTFVQFASLFGGKGA